MRALVGYDLIGRKTSTFGSVDVSPIPPEGGPAGIRVDMRRHDANLWAEITGPEALAFAQACAAALGKTLVDAPPAGGCGCGFTQVTVGSFGGLPPEPSPEQRAEFEARERSRLAARDEAIRVGAF